MYHALWRTTKMRIKFFEFFLNFTCVLLCSSSTNAYSYLVFSTLFRLKYSRVDYVTPGPYIYSWQMFNSDMTHFSYNFRTPNTSLNLPYKHPVAFCAPCGVKETMTQVQNRLTVLSIDSPWLGHMRQILNFFFINSPFICPVKFLHLVSKIIWIFFLSRIYLELLNVHFSLLFGRSKFSMSNTCHIPLFLLVN